MSEDRGKPQAEWLKNVDGDQNVQGLGSLDDSARNDARRKWFLSQQIVPAVIVGELDTATGKITTSGNKTIPRTSTSVLATSSATHTLTCPAGHAYKVIYASARDETTGPAYTLTYTPNGQTAGVIRTYVGNMIAAKTYALLGGTEILTDPGAGIYYSNINGPLWMRPGDALVITNANYVALDVCYQLFIYEDYTIGV